MMFFFGKDKKKTVRYIINQWETSQIANIAKDIVKLIPAQVPFLRDIAATSLTDLINRNLAFMAGEPREVSRGIYSIIDTVRVNVGPGIPLLDKHFILSINYNVKVNLKEKRVIEGRPDIRSLKIDFV